MVMPTSVGGDTQDGSVIVGDGDFVLDTRDLVEPAYMRPPVEVVKAADDWRPAEMMRRVCAAMAKSGQATDSERCPRSGEGQGRHHAASVGDPHR